MSQNANIQRAAVVAEARRWIGTPYHHLGDVLGAGVDCGMLLVRVYVDTGVVPPFDPRPYSPQWHLHRDDERYLGFLLERGVEVEKPQPGDIVVWKIGRAFAHGGIVTGWPLVVHAYQPEDRVVESDVSLPSPLSENKKRRFFNPLGSPGCDPASGRRAVAPKDINGRGDADIPLVAQDYLTGLHGVGLPSASIDILRRWSRRISFLPSS